MILVFLLLINIVVDATFLCTTKSGTLPTATNLICAECQFLTYLDPTTGVCVWSTNTTSTDTIHTSTIIPTNCDFMGYKECQLANGTCIPSQFGSLCTECHDQGFLVLNQDLSGPTCQCYMSQLDPALGCQPGTFFTVESSFMTLNRTFTKYTCEAHNSSLFGCFEPVDASGHKFGEPNPPVPYRCCYDWLGPSPGELREVFVAGQPFQECNTIGSSDPNLAWKNDTSFHTCSSHGSWNSTTRTCSCDRGWALDVIGKYPNGSNVLSCTRCSRWWGPSISDPLAEPPFCHSLFTADPIDGIERLCGGHGDWYPETRQCVCYSNSTAGHWSLGKVGTFEDGSAVQSCVIQL